MNNEDLILAFIQFAGERITEQGGNVDTMVMDVEIPDMPGIVVTLEVSFKEKETV